MGRLDELEVVMESHVMGVACDGAGVDSGYTTQDFEPSVDVR